jgi:pyrimidine operon attenuation protein/uracil phosphoribosyltransferase
MEKITLTCTNNGKTKEAEVLHKTDKYVKVVIPATQIVIELFRDDLNSEYTGHTAGLEFEWLPKH